MDQRPTNLKKNCTPTSVTIGGLHVPQGFHGGNFLKSGEADTTHFRTTKIAKKNDT
jgi:hypothetical protein